MGNIYLLTLDSVFTKDAAVVIVSQEVGLMCQCHSYRLPVINRIMFLYLDIEPTVYREA
jgi:hypothetical protein